MEQEVIQLLQSTQARDNQVRKAAEATLLQHYTSPDFSFALLSIGTHTSVEESIRQSALLTLNRVVVATWSPKFEDFTGTVPLDEGAKANVRAQILSISTGPEGEEVKSRKIRNAASLVATKIAAVDFPEEWPDLLPHLLQTLAGNTSDLQVRSALRVLSDLVESGFSEAQFFAVARELVGGLQTVATNGARKPIIRAFAINVFRACFDTLEMVMEDHRVAVKAFLDQALQAWIAFFIEALQLPLPQTPGEDEEGGESEVASLWRGTIALKLQVVKTLIKIRGVFPVILTPHSMVLFETMWEELSRLRPVYHDLYIVNDRQSRSEDADGLPYTLDFLVSEALDMMQNFLKAPPVKAELQNQLKAHPENPQSVGWLQQILQLLVSYAQITTEEEGLWEIDVNLYLSEETAVTANYTPRVACGDLAVGGLVEWLKEVPVEAVLLACKELAADAASTWKAKEAALFILNRMLRDFVELERQISPATALGFQDFVDQSQQDSSVYLRARSFAVAGVLSRTAGDSYGAKASAYLNAAIQTLAASEAPELIRVACIRAIQDLALGLPSDVAKSLQPSMIESISSFISSQDLNDPEVDDLKVSLIETLREVIMIDVSCTTSGNAVDLLFVLASHGAANFQVSSLVTETFEQIVSSVTALGHDAYLRLCEKTIPSLTGAFDVGNLTQESALTNLAAELVSALAEHGSSPLPDGFVAAVMPKLNRVLLESTEPELVRPCTLAVKHALAHAPSQFLAWTDPSTNKPAIETTLVIIDRLLNSSLVEDNAAAEVGGLAAELVEKAGADTLGPFLLQLLRAVALRLATATQAAFIQSLILVFARLCLSSAADVVEFLCQVSVDNAPALNIVLSKWLENSASFAGYEAIRQNAVALSKLYALQDPRVTAVAVKGDLIIRDTGRIKTRSRAKLEPDTWTSVPASVKILKVLVEELANAATDRFEGSGLPGAAGLESEGSEDADDWEDVNALTAMAEGGSSGSGGAGGSIPTLDLGLGLTKQELMAYEEESGGGRRRDDETSEYLVGWFREQATSQGFQEGFEGLNEGEKEVLRGIGG